jgi:serine/threonine-protein kinase
MFHRQTYGVTKPKLDFVCTEKDARLGGTGLRNAVIAGIRRTSSKAAMREWNQLGWYELAVFATLRAKCCASPPALDTATSFKQCKLDVVLTALGTAAAEADDEAVAKAVDDFQSAVACLVRNGAARRFKQPSVSPKASAVAAFLKMVERFDAAK